MRSRLRDGAITRFSLLFRAIISVSGLFGVPAYAASEDQLRFRCKAFTAEHSLINDLSESETESWVHEAREEKRYGLATFFQQDPPVRRHYRTRVLSHRPNLCWGGGT